MAIAFGFGLGLGSAIAPWLKALKQRKLSIADRIELESLTGGAGSINLVCYLGGNTGKIHF